jgi:hypothetical protein
LLAFLEDLEDLLLRMIRGVFLFIFVKLPRWTYETLLDWLPTGVKFVKVCLLAALWLSLLAGPALLGYFWMAIATRLSGVGIPLSGALRLYNERPLLYTTAGILWGLLALTASVWGIWHVKRRRVRRAAMPQPWRL